MTGLNFAHSIFFLKLRMSAQLHPGTVKMEAKAELPNEDECLCKITKRRSKKKR
jgi:hypothetical protein